jgi:hypothetical protein
MESTMEQDEMKMGRKEGREERGKREEKRKRKRKERGQRPPEAVRCPKRKYRGWRRCSVSRSRSQEGTHNITD